MSTAADVGDRLGRGARLVDVAGVDAAGPRRVPGPLVVALACVTGGPYGAALVFAAADALRARVERSARGLALRIARI